MTTELGGSLRTLRRSNQERLLSLLLERAPLHRAELARRAGLSRTTVSTIVTELLERGLVVETKAPDSRDGRAKEFLAVNPAAGVAAGLDFTLNRVWGHLTDLSGKPIASHGTTVASESNWSHRLDVSMELLDRLLGEAGLDRDDLIGIGVGVPGPIELATGVVGESLPGQAWAGVNVAGEFEARLSAPVFVENNTRLEAVAEIKSGAGRGARDVFFFGLSSGIGTGLFLDGKLYRGATGGAGEFGHVSVDINGPACPCGNRGCLVQYAAVPAVLTALRPRLGDDVTIDDVLTAAAEGDRACGGVIADVGQTVGQVLANICNLLNPERIIVAGELSRAGDLLLDPMRQALHRHALSLAREVDVVAADLSLGARAGAIGGAALVLAETPRLAGALLRDAA